MAEGRKDHIAELPGHCIPGLKADRVAVSGSFFLREGFHSEGEVSLRGACIGGDLNCSGGTFLKKDGMAFAADGIKVGHAVILRNGFNVDGEVRFVGAEVDGQLHAGGAQFGVATSVNLESAL